MGLLLRQRIRYRLLLRLELGPRLVLGQELSSVTRKLNKMKKMAQNTKIYQSKLILKAQNIHIKQLL